MGSSTTPLKYDSTTGLYGYGSGEPSPFIRTVRIDNDRAEEIIVNSFVEWRSKMGPQIINLEDHFFDWRVPAGS